MSFKIYLDNLVNENPEHANRFDSTNKSFIELNRTFL
jgi:hypothetical protein